MPVAQEREEDQLERLALPDDGLLDLGEDLLGAVAQFVEPRSQALQPGDDGSDLFLRRSRREAVGGRRPVGPHEIPGLLPEDPPGGVGLPLELDPVAHRESSRRCGAQKREERPVRVIRECQ